MLPDKYNCASLAPLPQADLAEANLAMACATGLLRTTACSAPRHHAASFHHDWVRKGARFHVKHRERKE